MSQIVIFDTETNGLPTKRDVLGNAEKGVWPDILSICWMVYVDETMVKTEYHLIKPEGWAVKHTEVHGLTQEMCETEGKPLAEVIGAFLNDVRASKYVVAHNLRFDKNVVFSAAKWRMGLDPKEFWPWGKDFCTACKGAVAGKIPKLDKLFSDIFGRPAPENAHNALRDVEVLRDVFFARFWPGLKASAAANASGEAKAMAGSGRNSRKTGPKKHRRKTRRN